jgi:hypothetical protein
LREEYWRSYLDFIEQQSVKLKGPQKLQQGSSCRNRPLEITVPDTNHKENGVNGINEEKIKTNQNGCSANGIDDEEKENVYNESELYWRIYYGGIESTIRPQVKLCSA